MVKKESFRELGNSYSRVIEAFQDNPERLRIGPIYGFADERFEDLSVVPLFTSDKQSATVVSAAPEAHCCSKLDLVALRNNSIVAYRRTDLFHSDMGYNGMTLAKHIKRATTEAKLESQVALELVHFHLLSWIASLRNNDVRLYIDENRWQKLESELNIWDSVIDFNPQPLQRYPSTIDNTTQMVMRVIQDPAVPTSLKTKRSEKYRDEDSYLARTEKLSIFKSEILPKLQKGSVFVSQS